MAMAGNQLPHHEETLGLQELQTPEYIVAPLFVRSIAGLTGGLKATIPSPELAQQIAFNVELLPL
jgi:hypothetical protein